MSLREVLKSKKDLVPQVFSGSNPPTTSSPPPRPTQQIPENNGGFRAVAIYVSDEEITGEMGSGIRQKFSKQRTGGARTELELMQLEKLRRVWESVFGSVTIPPHFKLETKSSLDGTLLSGMKEHTGKLFVVHEGFKPDAEYYLTTGWYRGIDSANGNFRPEAKAMINVICTFQSNKAKKNKVSYRGYPDDPENLFLEELKFWVTDKFANFTEKDKENILKRCGYLEDVLCKQDLFDQPHYRDVFTVQKVIVDVRRVLKSTIQVIDANLCHVDAARSVEEIMGSLKLLMDEAATLLWYSFRKQCTIEGQEETPDKAFKLHSSVLNSPDVRQVLLHRAKRNQNPTKKVIGFTEAGNLKIFEDYVPGNIAKVNGFAELTTDDHFSTIFDSESSGLDQKFCRNPIVARLYLESYALLMNLGSLFVVLKQAKGAAQTGGTMLLYGAANAEFNALLELSERLTDGIRTRLSKIVQVAEFRFEKLVQSNRATSNRCEWIGNYRELPRTLVQVEKNAAELFKVVGKARSEANALTLVERKEQAQEETESFLKAAKQLTGSAGKSLQLTFNSYKSAELATKAASSVDQVTAQLQKQEEADTKSYEKDLDLIEAAKRLEEENDSEWSIKDYLFTVKTSKKLGAGTDCDIGLVMTGTKGRTDLIQLLDEDKSKFETGKIDIFEIEVEGDIGELKDITLTLCGDMLKHVDSDWIIESVDILDKATKRTYNFPAAREKKLFRKKPSGTFPAVKSN